MSICKDALLIEWQPGAFTVTVDCKPCPQLATCRRQEAKLHRRLREELATGAPSLPKRMRDLVIMPAEAVARAMGELHREITDYQATYVLGRFFIRRGVVLRKIQARLDKARKAAT